MAALPFGAAAAVHGFNRVAHALEAILREDLGLPCPHYFDDFTLVLPRAFGEKVVERSKQALAKLGWAVAPGKKDLPLSPRFIALEVELDLSDATNLHARRGPVITVSNTPDRQADICGEIQQVLDANGLSPPVAAQLRGQLVFANAQLFGKCGALAFHLLGKNVGEGIYLPRLDGDLKWALTWLATWRTAYRGECHLVACAALSSSLPTARVSRRQTPPRA